MLLEERAEALRLSALERALDESYEHADSYPGFLALADTVGAGDSFTAAMVYGWLCDLGPEASLDLAMKAAEITISHDEWYELYEQVFNHSEYSLEKLTVDFFKLIFRFDLNVK